MGSACVPDGAITLFFGATDTDGETTVDRRIVTRMAMTRPLNLVPGESAGPRGMYAQSHRKQIFWDSDNYL